MKEILLHKECAPQRTNSIHEAEGTTGIWAVLSPSSLELDIGAVRASRPVPSLAPSKLLMQVLDRVTSSYDQPILDAPCGFGRNALALASRGYDVIAVDNDVVRLKSVEVSGALQSSGSGRIVTLCADLVRDRLPFRDSSFSAILCIHYPVQKVIVDLCTALKDGGWLYVETFGGQGQNCLELPKLGEIPKLLQGLELVLCKERPVGPPSQRAAVVQVLAQKRIRTGPRSSRPGTD